MSKKSIIIISIIIALALLAIAWFVISNKVGQQGEGVGESESSFFSSLFPFGKGESGEKRSLSSEGGDDGEGGSGGGTIVSSGGQLHQLTETSVSGAMSTIVPSPDGSFEDVVRYIDRETGNVFQINYKNFTKTRLTNTTIPGIREVVWGSNGRDVVVRYLNENDVIKTFAGVIATTSSITSTTNEAEFRLDGDFLEDDLIVLVPSPQNNKILYFSYNGNFIDFVTSDFDGSLKNTVVTSFLLSGCHSGARTK